MACKRSAVRPRYPPLRKALNCNGLRLFLLPESVSLLYPIFVVSLPPAFLTGRLLGVSLGAVYRVGLDCENDCGMLTVALARG